MPLPPRLRLPRGFLTLGCLLLLALTGPAAVLELVPGGTPWRLRPGTSEASSPDRTAWRSLGFDDTSWAAGPLPVFYGEALAGTPITGMQGAYASYFLRRRFTVANPADLAQLTLLAACDDGFIAWLNGREIARFNVPAGDLAATALALEPTVEPVQLEPYPIPNPATALQAGDNLLAVQVFNATLNSSDLVFDARLSAVVDEEPPTLAGITPPAGAQLSRLLSINLTFSERVRGVNAADLLLNGAPATNVLEFGPGQFEFTFPPPGPGRVTVAFAAGHGITDLSGAALPFAGASWQYLIDPATAPTTVIVSEFLADNQRGIRDDDGDRSDWIELHNTTRDALSLGGWSLTDNPTQLRKWVLPPVVLPGNGYLLVWASEKNRTNVGAALHANFRL
ncbi:MAG: lamin tail domain-containing protein, partial [Verrucomicrobiota bacterium]